MKASQEARLSKAVEVCQFFRTRPVCDARGRSTAPYCKELTRPVSILGCLKIGNIWKIQKMVPFWTYSSQEIKVSSALTWEVSTPSRLASVAWICISRGVTQRARQSSEFAPETEGTDTVFVNGGTAVGQAQPEIRIRASGDRLRFILKARRHHHPTDCTQAGQIPPGRALGDQLLSSQQCTLRNRVKFTWVKDVGM